MIQTNMDQDNWPLEDDALLEAQKRFVVAAVTQIFSQICTVVMKKVPAE